MPFVRMTTNQKLSTDQEIALKAAVADTISILPGKSEQVTMMQIEQNQTMWFRGEEQPCMFIQVKLYLESPLEAKKEFTGKLMEKAAAAINIPVTSIYFSFDEYPSGSWGSNGGLK